VTKPNDRNANRVVFGLAPGLWDKVTLAQTTLTDVYTFTLEGTTVGVVTLTFTDSSKGTLADAERTS